MGYVLIAAAIFGLCFLFDKLFTKAFRGKVQHQSGLAVKLNKRYAIIGLLAVPIGVVALGYAISGKDLPFIVGSSLVIAFGIVAIVYYLTFGIYYDEDTFLHSAFGRKGTVYHYRDIRAQQLYISGRSTVIELHMTDGKAVQLQSGMEGAYAFLNHAFTQWCRQKRIDPAGCEFHDPDNSCWFPSMEG